MTQIQMTANSHKATDGRVKMILDTAKRFEELKKILSEGILCDGCKKPGATKSLECGHRLCLRCVYKAKVLDLDFEKFQELKQDLQKGIKWRESDDHLNQKHDFMTREDLTKEFHEIIRDGGCEQNYQNLKISKTAISIRITDVDHLQPSDDITDKGNCGNADSQYKVITYAYQCPAMGCGAVSKEEVLHELGSGAVSEKEKLGTGVEGVKEELVEQKLLVLHTAADMMKLFEKEDLCSMCKTHDLCINAASHACIQCRQYLCDKCVDIHYDKTTFKQHAILPSSEPLTHALMGVCRKHHDLQLHCCLDCYSPLCPCCIVMDTMPSEHPDDAKEGGEVKMAQSIRSSATVTQPLKFPREKRRRALQNSMDIECPHANLHNFNEPENIWEVNKSCEKASTRIRKKIAIIEEQQRRGKSCYDEANKAVDLMLEKLSDLKKECIKHKENLQKKFSDSDEKINKLLETLKSQEEEISHYAYAQIVVSNSHLAQFCLGETVEERVEQHISDILEAFRQEKFQINIPLPKVEPFEVKGGSLQFLQEEIVGEQEEEKARSSTAGSGYDTISSSQLSSGYQKISSTNSSNSYQEIPSESSCPSESSNTPSSLEPPVTATPSESKPTRTIRGSNTRNSLTIPTIKVREDIFSKHTKKKLMDRFKKPSAQTLALKRKISRFQSGTLCY